MKKITEVKIKSKDSENSNPPDQNRQFDLQTAYKLLISAYLRTDPDTKQTTSLKES